MSELKEYFEKNTQNCINKWDHYFEIYEFWFKKYRNKPVTILEIGVYQGGSLKMWREYFGKEAKIYAIDINPLCKQFETENTKIFIGSQDDKEFLAQVKMEMPQVDIFIDDGGHMMEQQKVSFLELYPHIKENGLYLCEDLHTSYWTIYGGGYNNSKSFIEFSKTLIDKLNAWHISNNELLVDTFTKTTYSLHYYDSVLVIEKKRITQPTSKMTGKNIIPLESFPHPSNHKYGENINYYVKNIINRINLFINKFIR